MIQPFIDSCSIANEVSEPFVAVESSKESISWLPVVVEIAIEGFFVEDSLSGNASLSRNEAEIEKGPSCFTWIMIPIR